MNKVIVLCSEKYNKGVGLSQFKYSENSSNKLVSILNEMVICDWNIFLAQNPNYTSLLNLRERYKIDYPTSYFISDSMSILTMSSILGVVNTIAVGETLVNPPNNIFYIANNFISALQFASTANSILGSYRTKPQCDFNNQINSLPTIVC